MVCFALGPLSLGDCGSESKINITTQSLTSSITNSYTETIASSKTSTINISNQKVTLNGYTASKGCSNLIISQDIKLDLEANTTISNTTAQKMLKNLATTINNDIDQKMDQVKSALADVNNTSLIMNAKNIITKISEDTSVIKSAQDAVTETLSVSGQEVTINFGNLNNLNEILTEGTSCKISQDIQAKIVATATLNTLIDALNSDTEMQEIQSKLEQDQKLKSKGAIEAVGDVISSVFRGLFTVYGVIVVAIVIGIVLFWYFVLKNPEGTRAVGQAATSIIKQAGETGSQTAKAVAELKKPI